MTGLKVATLHCTCGAGSGGTAQEVVERRLTQRLGLDGHRVHALLDLMDTAVNEALDAGPGRAREDGEIARHVAARTGIPIAEVEDFLAAYERVREEVRMDVLELAPGDHLRELRRKLNRKA